MRIERALSRVILSGIARDIGETVPPRANLRGNLALLVRTFVAAHYAHQIRM